MLTEEHLENSLALRRWIREGERAREQLDVSCNDDIIVTTMNAKSVGERVSDLRARRKAEGFVKMELWVHPNDVSRLKKEAIALTARRERILKETGVVLPSLEEENERLVRVSKKKVAK